MVMAGDDSQMLSNGTAEAMTIVPPNGKIPNGNGVICINHNGNGKISNDKPLDLVTLENGKSIIPMDEKSPIPINEKSPTFHPDFIDDEVSCGWGLCRPKWLQIFTNKQTFLAIFCLTWMLQGMYYTYFVSVITTIEKLFQFQSKTTGIILSATEIGQIGSSLLLSYYAGQGHRPKWIAWGMVLLTAGAFTCSIPHFMFSEQDMQTQSAKDTSPINLCKSIDLTDNKTFQSYTDNPDYCKGDYLEEQQTQSKIKTVVFAIFFLSRLGVGMGQTAVYTLGIPYIDDNIASQESPLYFTITTGVRILGPALGYMLGSMCTRLYIDLSVEPPVTPTDPNWVGAWWLGLLLISGMLILASIAMFAFPTRLPTSKAQPKRADSTKPSIKDFPKAMKRLLQNDILIFRTASSVLHILPIAGLYSFLPKYLESQFRLPSHNANMVSGVGGVLVMGLGIILSGFFILRWKPSARFVAGWIAFTSIAYAIGMGTLMFVGCTTDNFAGLVQQPDGLAKFVPTCDPICDCDRNKFNPLCGSDGQIYYSPCHAGCSNTTYSDGKLTSYSECHCIGQNQTGLETLNTGTAGYCELECNNFLIYMIIFSLSVFIHSTGEVGSMLLTLRCVDAKDKAMALGLIQFAIGLFATIPCSIVYGAVVDSACLVWEYSCGSKGACSLYDSNNFRLFFHGTTGGLILLGFLVDVIVWYRARSINFSDEPDGTVATTEEMANLKARDAGENDYL